MNNVHITIPIPVGEDGIPQLTLLKSKYELIGDAGARIPKLPGESIHLGYLPITEEDAFSDKYTTPPPHLHQTHFRIPREQNTVADLCELIHHFIGMNDSVDLVVPKIEWLNGEPNREIYKATVIFTNKENESTKIIINLLADKASNEIIVSVGRYSGSPVAHKMFFNTMEQFIKSNGSSYPLIRRVSVDKQLLESATPPSVMSPETLFRKFI
jgi:hypothetical protein